MQHASRTFIVVAIALVTASTASFAMYRAVARLPRRQVAAPQTSIVVAARPRPLGARLTAEDVKLVPWPADMAVADSFAQVADVVGRGLVSAVSENEPLTEARLAPRGAGAGLSPTIAPGMRAISVRVNEVIGVAGFVTPGAHVDVVATVRRPTDAVARVLVANVLVLTAGTRDNQDEAKSGKATPLTVVTLAVTPGEAEQIALASTEGQVTLTLRNPLDGAAPVTPGAALNQLVQTSVARDAVPAATVRLREARPTAPPAIAPAVYVIETIKGGKRTEETLK